MSKSRWRWAWCLIALSLLIGWDAKPTLAQEAVGWSDLVASGQLEAELRGGTPFEAVPMVTLSLVNISDDTLYVAIPGGNLLSASDHSCTLLLSFAAETIQLIPNESASIPLPAYCLELPAVAPRPTGATSYTLQPEDQAIRNVLHPILTQAQTHDLNRALSTQLAIWQRQHNLDNKTLPSTLALDNLSPFETEIALLLDQPTITNRSEITCWATMLEGGGVLKLDPCTLTIVAIIIASLFALAIYVPRSRHRKAAVQVEASQPSGQSSAAIPAPSAAPPPVTERPTPAPLESHPSSSRPVSHTPAPRVSRVRTHQTVPVVDEPTEVTQTAIINVQPIEYVLKSAEHDTLGVLPVEGGLITRAALSAQQIVLPAPLNRTTSSPHARLRRDQDRYYLSDLRSRNGTFVDGVRLQVGEEFELYDAAVVRFGSAEFRFDGQQHTLTPYTASSRGGSIILPPALTTGGVVVITRQALHQLRISDNPRMSAPHLLIQPGGEDRDSIYLKDLGSRNRVKLDNNRLLHKLPNAAHIAKHQVHFLLGGKTYHLEARRQRALQSLGKHYDVVNQIYGSRMAELFKVRDRRSGQFYVAKLLLTGQYKYAEAKLAFEREVRLMRDLGSHEGHILPALAGGIDPRSGNAPFFIMPLLEGNDLSQLLSQRMDAQHGVYAGFQQNELRAIFKAVCAALEKLHTRGFVHGDIKPSNVFVTTGGRVVLLDFGVTTAIGEWGIFGTPFYSPPEIMTVPRKPVDKSADIYSLGVLLFELLTGLNDRNLADGATDIPDTNLALHHSADAAWLTDTLSEILAQARYGAAFAPMITKATRYHGEARHSTVHEFVREFDAVQLH